MSWNDCRPHLFLRRGAAGTVPKKKGPAEAGPRCVVGGYALSGYLIQDGLSEFESKLSPTFAMKPVAINAATAGLSGTPAVRCRTALVMFDRVCSITPRPC